MLLSTQFTLLCHCCKGVTKIDLTLHLSACVGSLIVLYLFLKKYRLRSFVDESEWEMMHEQIVILQDKVLPLFSF
jgi:hypothetical protein